MKADRAKTSMPTMIRMPMRQISRTMTMAIRLRSMRPRFPTHTLHRPFPRFALSSFRPPQVHPLQGPETRSRSSCSAPHRAIRERRPGYIVSVTGTFDSATTFDAWRLTLSAGGQIPAFVLKPDGFGLVSSAVPVTGGAANQIGQAPRRGFVRTCIHPRQSRRHPA